MGVSMKLQPKWALWTMGLGVLGTIVGFTLHYHFYKEFEASWEGVTLVSVPNVPPPLFITLLLCISCILLPVSIVILSGSKWLRWIAALSTISIGFGLVRHLPERDNAILPALFLMLGSGVLFIATIASIAIIIASWLKKRSKK
jgi:hypothetical protein